jgi:hypothetical protein
MKTRYCAATSLDGLIATLGDSLEWLFPLDDIAKTSYPDFFPEVGALAMRSSTHAWMLRNVALLALALLAALPRPVGAQRPEASWPPVPGRDPYSVEVSGLTHAEPPVFRVDGRFGVHPVGISTVRLEEIAEVRALEVGSGGGTCKVVANVGGIVGGFLVGGLIGGLLEHAFYPRSDGVTGLVGGAVWGAILGGLFVPRLCDEPG